MLRATLFGLVASALVNALHAQVPPRSVGRREEEYPFIHDGDKHTAWRLDEVPCPDSTDNLVFETTHSLLQHWPNTRMRNGHSIVPGTISKGTRLYHGTIYTEYPPGPDWVAIDPEHSYFFCRDPWIIFPVPEDSKKGCWHHTLAATRPLKVIYFDGTSAAKLPFGTLDTQDLLAWGKAHPEDMWEEFQLIEDLCKWGKSFGVDGFVRMEMSFEVMLCDLASSVHVVSSANLERPQGVLPFMGFVMFEVMNAGSRHDRFPGETRIQLDLAGLVSFYDTQLVPSLVSARAGQERWDHRVQNISSEDISALKSRLEVALIRPEGLSSGVDWRTLIQVIVDRFAKRLELTRYLLNLPATGPHELVDLANTTQVQLRIMLTPYLPRSATPTDPSDKTDLDWTIPIYKLCATVHTHGTELQLDSMTDSEKLLLRAVQGTSREICRVVTKMWAAGVYAGIDLSLNTKGSPDVGEIAQLRSKWTEELNRLMAWLDWSVWVKCNPECGPGEMCYLPTWPMGFPLFPPPWGNHDPPPGRSFNFNLRTGVIEHFAKEVQNIVQSDPEEWVRPQPKCIPQFAPYNF